MMQIRRSSERGHTQLPWLDSRHTFSFGEYQDDAHMGYGWLRVINDDRVIPGAGFGTHGHRDMEILSYVLEGALEHKDSIGTGSVIRPGELQIMSAGKGILHSEFNSSKTAPVHFLQIWIIPDRTGIAPRYEQKRFPLRETPGEFVLVGSRDGRGGSLTVHQDVEVLAGVCEAGQGIRRKIDPGRRTWIHVARGALRLNGQDLSEGDGAAISGETDLAIEGRKPASELLVFDLPATPQ